MKTDITEKQQLYLERSQAILDETDPTVRWRMVHDLLREVNNKAKREQDKQAKAMAKVREEKIYNNKLAPGGAGLKFAVSIPNITWQALVAVDGRLKNPEKNKGLTKNATNELARELARVFPEYKAS